MRHGSWAGTALLSAAILSSACGDDGSSSGAGGTSGTATGGSSGTPPGGTLGGSGGGSTGATGGGSAVGGGLTGGVPAAAGVAGTDGGSGGVTMGGAGNVPSTGGAAGAPGGSGGTGGATGGTGSAASTGGSGGGATGWRTSCKRGVAYGQHSDADLGVLSSAVAWWYNWHFLPDAELSPGTYPALRVEYVPMAWGAGTDLAALQAQAPADATTLLGYNEPNFYAQANLSAAEAAARWSSLQAVADARGLRLIAPAVNYCGGGCHDTDPFAYLRAFFAACAGCRVDAIAVHIYVGCAGANGNRAQWLIDHLTRYKEEFTQPIWLTEFACDDAQNADEQRAFMQDAVAYLEADPRVERYAWFAGRADNVPYVDLLGADGELTPLGAAYVSAPASGDCSL